MSHPPIIYKYVDQEGARKIIGNGTLRFSRPSDMNDPFDVYIEDLFNVDLEEIHNRSIADMLDLLQREPFRFAALVGATPKEAQTVSDLIRSCDPATRSRMIAEITPARIRNEDRGLAEAWKRIEGQRETVIAQFRNSAIFCATKNHDNLLMWAHYAQQHRGVVLGFRPDIERDSFLRLMKPVRYSDRRPKFYQSINDMIINNSAFTEEDMAELKNNLIYSKSLHWSYEEEIRMDIPHGVPVGQPATFFKFYPAELCKMYLGIRAEEPFKSEIISAARALNREIEIFAARLERESYALAFESVT